MASDLQKLLSVLANANIEFVVIGGVAMVVHGSAYVTFDLDVCYGRSPENIDRICEALALYKPRLRGVSEELPFRLDPKTVKNGLNFTLSTNIGDLDLLGEVPGIGTYDDVVNVSEWKDVEGNKFRVLTLDGLIRSKKAAGRKKDLNALPELEGLQELKEKTRETE